MDVVCHMILITWFMLIKNHVLHKSMYILASCLSSTEATLIEIEKYIYLCVFFPFVTEIVEY